MSTKGGRGGARPHTGPKVRRIFLDNDTVEMVRALTKERRAISPDITEHQIVNEMIREAWDELDQEYQAAGEQQPA